VIGTTQEVDSVQFPQSTRNVWLFVRHGTWFLPVMFGSVAIFRAPIPL
jgi:hypothetical protein